MNFPPSINHRLGRFFQRNFEFGEKKYFQVKKFETRLSWDSEVFDEQESKQELIPTLEKVHVRACVCMGVCVCEWVCVCVRVCASE